jgi:hypothetical protein
MGNFYSGANSYLDVYKFDSDSNIDFQFNQLRTFETVKAAGQQQALAQVANVGGLGGGGGGFAAATPWGNSASIWLGLSNFFVLSAALVVPVGIVVAVLSFVLYLGRAAAFFSVFAAVMSASIWFIYHTERGRRTAMYFTLTLYGLVCGLVGGAIAAAAYTEPVTVVNVGGAAGGVADRDNYYYPRVPVAPVRL